MYAAWNAYICKPALSSLEISKYVRGHGLHELELMQVARVSSHCIP